MTAWETLCDLLEKAGAKLTFSINCHSGIVSLLGPDRVCGCWRCRESRGEPWTEETEAEAAEQSNLAQAAMRRFALKRAGGAE